MRCPVDASGAHPTFSLDFEIRCYIIFFPQRRLLTFLLDLAQAGLQPWPGHHPNHESDTCIGDTASGEVRVEAGEEEGARGKFPGCCVCEGRWAQGSCSQLDSPLPQHSPFASLSAVPMSWWAAQATEPLHLLSPNPELTQSSYGVFGSHNRHTDSSTSGQKLDLLLASQRWDL